MESAIVRPRLSSTVIALGFVSLLNDIGGDLVTPLLPSFVAAVGGGPQVLGLIEGMADAATSLVQLGSGYLADRLGPLKLITFAGYGIAAVARPLLALAGAWWQIMVVRLADRIGKGVRSAPRDALVAEATVAEARGRAYGFHRAMDNGGAALGPAAAYLMLRGGMSPACGVCMDRVSGCVGGFDPWSRREEGWSKEVLEGTIGYRAAPVANLPPRSTRGVHIRRG